MKKVVKGLLYDTDTSTLLYEDPNNHRKLYRTKGGNFFTLYRNGELVPKTEENAKEYLGSRDVDKYVEVFGEPKEA